jgi:murein DD-endopeptidase MepM/ murein hydrolase activator NlpD
MTVLLFPVPASTPVSQVFGVNRLAYAAYGLSGHNGVDFACPTGTPITAADAGEVIMAAYNGGYGRCVRVQHSHGMTLYGHLTSFGVKVGQKVDAGEFLGLSGGGLNDPQRGNSTGPHLHFEYRPLTGGLSGYGGAIDPWPLLSAEGASMEDEVIAKGTVVTKLGIKVRAGASTSYAQIGTLIYGSSPIEIVEKKTVNSGEVWVRLRSPRVEWAAAVFGGTQLMSLADVASIPANEEKTLTQRIEALEVAARAQGWPV